jgi:hypothetical protein
VTTVDGGKKSIRVQVVLATALAIVGLAGSAHAQADSGPVDLKVVDRDTGRVLRVWRHDGRLFVAGRPGARYSLRVNNHTDGRVLVVLSVDGVNILTGETAGYDQRGYVFSPHESYDLAGWRKSDTQIAAFKFAPQRQSYAARTGRPADVGVIGMAVFREKVYAPPPEPEVPENRWEDRDDLSRGGPADAVTAGRAAPAPAPPATVTGRRAASGSPSQETQDRSANGLAMRDEKLGTGHGAREWSVVTTVPFERETAYPQFIRQIEYDTYANLVASGVIQPPAIEHRPRPFPTYPDGAGYVPDPPG